ncbi:sigma-70 family RNA polymerase sigma factor [Streptomyces sp. NBC_00237]|uniref:sigma-70 family RNA polymerase sigma factor n=1 Tax=Streptomyces sp. NBC_00237 TaxID=2975687 RepID=UPI00225691D8|nr:sigma-70 family RNA polymerase sigma factor [Streptomyces sp. NBC_00237]MCX5204460.1 sigma-70 family RNA polymerase sigma factor [Streptomyces sp. NBC_00237]
MNREHGVARVLAAQSGDPQAQDALVAAYLPLVYNIVGRALHGHADVDDVVQETMLRALDGLGTLRIPESFRSWLVAIAMNEVRRHWERGQAAVGSVGPVHEEREVADPAADFVGLTLVRMGLSGQRKETVEATRWLDGDDRALLSLWWLEAAGELTRAEVATALELPPDHTAVRVQRMKSQLEASRVVVRALAAVPLCGQLRDVIGSWDGVPSALWRKRISRHAKECAACSGHRTGLVPAEGLLAGFGLVPVAGALVAGVSAAVRGGGGGGFAPVGHAQGVPYATQAIQATEVTQATQAVQEAEAVQVHSAMRGTQEQDLSYDAAHQQSAGAGEGDGRAAGPSRSQRRQQRTRRKRHVIGAAALLALIGGGFGVFRIFSGGDGGTSTSVADAARTGAPVLPSSAAPSTGGPTPTRTVSASASASASATPTKPAASKSPKPTKTSAKPKPPPKPPKTTKPVPPAPPAPPAGPAQEVVRLLNTERAKAGCSALSSNSLLRTAAQRHSEDMVSRGFFDHTNPDGDGPGERVTAAGYKWMTYGENIAAGQATPAAVMEGWMNSPGHRANILNCAFKEVGIGIKDASGGIRWTQVFGAR